MRLYCYAILACGIDGNNMENTYSLALTTRVLYPRVQVTHRLFICVIETIVCVAFPIIGWARYWFCTGGKL